jgi:hypothetical protein
MVVVVVTVTPVGLAMPLAIDSVAVVVGIGPMVTLHDATRQSQKCHDCTRHCYPMNSIHASLPFDSQSVPHASDPASVHHAAGLQHEGVQRTHPSGLLGPVEIQVLESDVGIVGRRSTRWPRAMCLAPGCSW